ncbi:MAG: CDP-alcohol phosphatidyltransferase family protein [Vicinamibacteria bacterium]
MNLSLQNALVVLALAVGSVAVYAAIGHKPDKDAKDKGTQFFMGVGNFLVHWFMWAIGPIERLSLALGLTPDFFNWTGLLLGIVAGLLFGLNHLGWGGIVMLLGGICDVLDGRIARSMKSVSSYGAFIDSTLDRFVEVFAFLGLVFRFRGTEWGPLLAAAAITGSLLVSYTRARGESQGVLCKEGLMQRAERIALLVFAAFFDGPITIAAGWPPGSVVMAVLAIIAAGTFATAFHRTFWIGTRLRERDRQALEPK